MARVCDILCNKAVLSGHKVSHSNRKSKKRFLPNLQNVTLISDSLAKTIKMRISTKAIRSIDQNGGLDSYLLTTPNCSLTEQAQKLKKAIRAKAPKIAKEPKELKTDKK